MRNGANGPGVINQLVTEKHAAPRNGWLPADIRPRPLQQIAK